MSNQQESQAKASLHDLQFSARQAVEMRLLLAKMEATEKGALFGSRLMLMVIAGSLITFAFTFLSISAALLLAKWTGSYAAGFAIVGGIILLKLLLLLAFGRKKLLSRATDAVIAAVFSDEQHRSH
jgi:prolipoprotein diacylglyceryltransferase